jgi:hypothetical protein
MPNIPIPPDNTVPGDPLYYGRVRPGTDPLKTSTLVDQFQANIGKAAEAVVLRGYTGNTTNVDRALEFMKIAERNGQPVAEKDEQAVKDLRELEDANLARIYLTPRLDRYVDFHRSCLLAWRYEANSLRQDMVTVWLKRYDNDNVAITYRAIEEAVIGAAPAAYLGGELLDDALSQPTSQSSAWGSGAGATVGNKYWTAPACGG